MADRQPCLLPNKSKHIYLTESHRISPSVPNLTIAHQISLNLTKSHHIAQNLTKSHRILQNLTLSHRILQNLTKSH